MKTPKDLDGMLRAILSSKEEEPGCLRAKDRAFAAKMLESANKGARMLFLVDDGAGLDYMIANQDRTAAVEIALRFVYRQMEHFKNGET